MEAISNVTIVTGTPSSSDQVAKFGQVDQVASDLATLDGEVVKKTGDQSISGVKTFNSFPQVYYPANKTYSDDEFVRHVDIISKANVAASAEGDDIKTNVLGGVNIKYIDIGGWDMDTDSYILIPFESIVTGLTKARIKNVICNITNDLEAENTDINTAGNIQWGSSAIAPSYSNSVKLSRDDSGYFDNTAFNDDTINRGVITVFYTD